MAEYEPHKTNILLVDDNAANLRLLLNILNGQGYAVRAAPNGRLALEAARVRPPDLVLLDILMPDMSGFEVCAALKREPATRDIPVIFLSALHETAEKLKAFEAGGVDYITKPFAPEEVLVRVRTQISLREMQRQLADKNAQLRDAADNLEKLVEQRTRELAETIADLRESETRFRLLVATSPLAMLVTGPVPEQRVVLMNERFTELFGYDMADVKDAASWWPQAYPDPNYRREIQTRWEQAVETMLTAGKHHIKAVGAEVTCKNGQVRSVEVHMALQADQSLIIFNDLTERHANQRELERWGHVFRNAGWGIAVCDAESGVLTLVNPCLAHSHGYTVEELIGRNFSILFSPTEHDRLTGIIRQAHENGHLIFESEHIRRDGSTFPVRIDVTTVKDDAGKPLWRVSNILDTTQEKEAEQKLLRTIDALTRSNTDLERFAYAASHDLKEPLRTIVAFTQLLERKQGGRLDDETAEVMGFIIDGAKRMVDLVQGLLEFSRIESQGQRFTLLRTQTAVDAALDNLGQALDESGAQITCGVLPDVMADDMQIVHLFQNLIGNAIKFRRLDRPLRIGIDCLRQGGQWEFSVTDNGIGIDPAYGDQVFVIFKRLHTHEAYPGSGIGLALCKRIVERHGGRIWFDSKPGETTSFHFTLPAIEA